VGAFAGRASPARPPPLLLSIAAVRYAMLSAIRTAPAAAARRVCALFHTQTREVLNAYSGVLDVRRARSRRLETDAHRPAGQRPAGEDDEEREGVHQVRMPASPTACSVLTRRVQLHRRDDELPTAATEPGRLALLGRDDVALGVQLPPVREQLPAHAQQGLARLRRGQLRDARAPGGRRRGLARGPAPGLPPPRYVPTPHTSHIPALTPTWGRIDPLDPGADVWQPEGGAGDGRVNAPACFFADVYRMLLSNSHFALLHTHAGCLVTTGQAPRGRRGPSRGPRAPDYRSTRPSRRTSACRRRSRRTLLDLRTPPRGSAGCRAGSQT
jgi:hypothetical protein